MPNVTVFRRLYNITDDVQLNFGTRNMPGILTLFPGSSRRKAYVPPNELNEFLTDLKALEAAGQIGWHLDNSDEDPDSVRILGGLDVANGTSSNTVSNYYVNVSPGAARVGSKMFEFQGVANADPLALGIDIEGESMATALLADGYARKCRWFLARQYNVADDSESLVLLPVFGALDVTATLGAVTTDTGMPTDLEVEDAITAANSRLAATRMYVAWIEIGRQLFSRSSTTISTSFVDKKDSDPAANKGIQLKVFDVSFDDAAFAVAATSTTITDARIEHALFLGAGLRVLEATDLAVLNVSLGKTGQTNELFDVFDAGTGGSAAAGAKQTAARASSPVLAGGVLLNYTPLLTIATSGVNLDTATQGRLLVFLYYLPFPEVGPTDLGDLMFDESLL